MMTESEAKELIGQLSEEQKAILAQMLLDLLQTPLPVASEQD